MSLFSRLALPFWSIVIAIVLWVQVHGQGVGSLRMDVALQVRDVPADMVIVNDLPDQVSITVSGLQTQLNALDAKNLFVTVDASGLNLPGVVEQALDIEGIDLPVGLRVEKIQPDTLQLQVDHVTKRTLDIETAFDLPQGWTVEHVIVTPANAEMTGPEVWLGTMNKIETAPLRLDLKQGLFDVNAALVPLSEKGIHLTNEDLVVRVRGELVWQPTEEVAVEPEVSTGLAQPEALKVEKVEGSIVPAPEDVKATNTEGSDATEASEKVIPAPEEGYSQPQEKAVPVGDL
jgi:hypothetical protein